MNCHLTLILGKMTEFFKKLIKPYIDHFQSILTTILGGGGGGGILTERHLSLHMKMMLFLFKGVLENDSEKYNIAT